MVVRAAGRHAGFRSRAMPHFGQSPGPSETTPSHIGQKYFAEDDFVEGALASPLQQWCEAEAEGFWFKV